MMGSEGTACDTYDPERAVLPAGAHSLSLAPTMRDHRYHLLPCFLFIF